MAIFVIAGTVGIIGILIRLDRMNSNAKRFQDQYLNALASITDRAKKAEDALQRTQETLLNNSQRDVTISANDERWREVLEARNEEMRFLRAMVNPPAQTRSARGIVNTGMAEIPFIQSKGSWTVRESSTFDMPLDPVLTDERPLKPEPIKD